MSNYRPYRRQGISPLWVLIGVCTVIFLAEYLLDTNGLIFERFALIPSTLSSQPWTILTYMFLHGSWSHIIFNMISLYFLGTMAMYLVGETAFLVVFFLGGIFGGLVVILLAPVLHQTGIAVVGSSGAIFALGGLLMVMRPNIKVMMFLLPIEMPLWVGILINFFLVAIIPGVSWQAHLGGIIFGAAVGYYLRQRETRHF